MVFRNFSLSKKLTVCLHFSGIVIFHSLQPTRMKNFGLRNLWQIFLFCYCYCWLIIRHCQASRILHQFKMIIAIVKLSIIAIHIKVLKNYKKTQPFYLIYYFFFAENESSMPKGSFSIDFIKLFHALSQTTHTEEGTVGPNYLKIPVS